MTLGIVLLNYLSYKETIECITSIEKQEYQDFKIVVVDNGSTNQSLQFLTDYYKKNEKVHVMTTGENLGFAKGNNAGIAYFTERSIFNCLVINNDTLLEDPAYLTKLIELELPSDVGMVGTKIRSQDYQNQNTVPVTILTKAMLNRNRLELGLIEFLTRTNVLFLLQKLRKKLQNNSKKEQVETSTTTVLDPKKEMLHGSALYFTEAYLRNYQGFYPDTFLYYEEELLALICRKLNFKQVYFPEIEIYHKEDASSNMAFNFKKKQALLFKVKCIKQSIQVTKQALALPTKEFEKKMKAKD